MFRQNQGTFWGSSIPVNVGRGTQDADLDKHLNYAHTKNVVGAFCEAVGAYAIGAKEWKGSCFPLPSRIKDEWSLPGEPPRSVMPDLIKEDSSTLVEVKGGRDNGALKVFEWQAQAYDALRKSGDWPIYRPRVEYLFILHGLTKRITATYHTPRGVIAALARNVELAVLVDLDVVLQFSSWCGVREHGQPNGSYWYPPFYNLLPRYLKRLAKEPRACLDELGLNGNRFRVLRWEVGRSEALLLHQVKVCDEVFLAPFPLTYIKKVRGVRKPYEEEVPF